MNTKSISLLSSVILVANFAFAEPAPVYDADSMFDQSMAEQQQQQAPQPPQQDLPPPPSPDQDSTFVPMQNEAANQINNDATNVSAPAQNPADRPSRPLTTDQRIKRLEHIIDLIQNSEGTAQVDSLQNQVQELRAQVEGLTRQLQTLQAQQKAAPVDASKPASTPAPAAAATTTTPAAPTPVKYSSLDNEVNTKLTTKPANVSKTVAANNQPNVAEEQQIYQTAYNLIKAKKFAEAATTLQNMLHKYPSGQFASNAHYWLGELYGVMGKNDLALNEFSTVVKNYSESPRVSDAQLKLGLIYSAQSKWSDAKAAFKRVINRYPGTTSARLAMEQLKQIKSAGH